MAKEGLSAASAIFGLTIVFATLAYVAFAATPATSRR